MTVKGREVGGGGGVWNRRSFHTKEQHIRRHRKDQEWEYTKMVLGHGIVKIMHTDLILTVSWK